jgi:hypothetical protein
MQVIKREKRMFNYIVLAILATGIAIAAWLLWYPK